MGMQNWVGESRVIRQKDSNCFCSFSATNHNLRFHSICLQSLRQFNLISLILRFHVDVIWTQNGWMIFFLIFFVQCLTRFKWALMIYGFSLIKIVCQIVWELNKNHRLIQHAFTGFNIEENKPHKIAWVLAGFLKLVYWRHQNWKKHSKIKLELSVGINHKAIHPSDIP